MFNLEKREKFIILFLLTLLVIGLAIGFYKNSAPSIDVRVNSFSPDSDIQPQLKKVNINEADPQSIASLKGIGPALAKRIVEYRSKNGYFRSTEELKKVKGVGNKLFEKIKNDISIE